MSWLGGLTERLELGTSVTILPYRHPLWTARTAANIDQFTGGRFILGVGAGWSEPEFSALGLPFGDRGRIADEYLRAITDAWDNDVVSLDGDYVSYRDVTTGPRSARSPHPPLWIGGSSPKAGRWGRQPQAIRRAAHVGDAWHPINADLGWLRDTGLPALHAAARALGRPVPAFCPRIRARLTAHQPSKDRPIGIGSGAQIQADLDALVELGAAYIVLDTNPDDPADRRPAAEDLRTLATIADGARAHLRS